MAWIALHQSVWTHRKTMALGTALGIDDTYAAAHMARLWCWALDNAADGCIASIPPAVLARAAGWAGAGAAFSDALMASGWVDADGWLHDWEEYAGRLIESREAERQRSATRRAEAKARRAESDRVASSGRPGGDQPTTGGRPAVGQQTTGGTKPNHTEPDPLASLGGAPAAAGAAPSAPRVEPLPIAGTEAAPPALPQTRRAELGAECQRLATSAYDALCAADRRPAEKGWVGRAIGRIRQLTPAARALLPEAIPWAVQPGAPSWHATWLAHCDFGALLGAYTSAPSAGATARASPPQEPAAYAGIREFLRRAEGGDAP